MSTSAVCNGIAYHQEQEIVAVKRAMLRAAARSICSSTIPSSARRRCINSLLSAFDLVVVDDGVDEGAPRVGRSQDPLRGRAALTPGTQGGRIDGGGSRRSL